MKAIPFYLTLCVLCPAFAQDVPPPPKPADSGPTLEVTMKYIQDRLNGEGKVSDQVTLLGTDTPGSFSYSSMNAIADAASCTLSVKLVFGSEDFGQSEVNVKLSFRDVAKLMVESHADAARRAMAALGQNVPANYSPTIFLLTWVLGPGKTMPNHVRAIDPKGIVTEKDYPPIKEAGAYFREEETAQRTAKAMVHAVELCGGGKDDDPFK
jgi:hypothetical protein